MFIRQGFHIYGSVGSGEAELGTARRGATGHGKVLIIKFIRHGITWRGSIWLGSAGSGRVR